MYFLYSCIYLNFTYILPRNIYSVIQCCLCAGKRYPLILLINCVPNQLIIYLNRCPTLIVLLNYVSQLELSTCKDVLLSLYFWSVSQNCQIKTVPRRITGNDLTIEWIFILYFCGNYICLFRIYETWIYRVSAKTLSILLLFIS